MRAIQAYLTFDGNAREAMTFYQRCLDAELSVQTFGDAHAEGPPGTADRVMHARVTKGSAILMASDTMPGMPFTQGDNFSICMECETIPEIEKLFVAFAQGGKVTMPLADQFWGARFGMITDKFGVNWMFNCELPKEG